MITYKNEYGEYNELTVTEFKEELEKLEEKGYGNYIVNIGYDGNCCYTSAGNDEPEIDDENKGIYFDTDTTF